ncbi:MAG TPA: response regulator [Chthoniobacterales bacterium]|nr:response regulator [Chthoniobacterales bacterium]
MDDSRLQSAEFLIVDDELTNLTLLKKILRAAGYTQIRTTTEPRKVAALVAEKEPDIILLDLQMPHLDGFALLKELKETLLGGTFLPILVLTADAMPQTKMRALSSGAHDFLTKPFSPAEVVQRVGNLLQTRLLYRRAREQNRNLEVLVSERTSELEKAVHELKETQEKAIQHERLNAFGTMASGIAHDFNNALAIILGFGEVALIECEGRMRRPELEAHLQAIISAGLDASRMIKRLREFYRPGAKNEPREVVHLNNVIQEAIATTRPKWHAESLGAEILIEMQTNLTETPPILADAAELRDALMNLIFNAVDAMPKGGVIRLSTSYSDQRVVVQVRDGGIGMPEEVRRHCLEPFFTTKGEAGTGLGLAMVYGIVERHGGEIEIETEPGFGTTFVLSFPPALDPAKAIATPLPRRLSRLKILVADDQPEICSVLTSYLLNDAHEVRSVTDARPALEAIRAEKFDLLITDHVMHGMSGKQLAAAVKEVSPETRVILLTSMAENGGATASRVIDRVLAKPVSMIDLRRAIAEVMSDSVPSDLPALV